MLEFLDPIAPGLERRAFMAALEERIETATDSLIREGGGGVIREESDTPPGESRG